MQKKKLSLGDMGDIKIFVFTCLELRALKPSLGLKSRELSLMALTSTLLVNCVLYAIDTWRYLGFKETDDLDLFIIDHLMSDDNFEILANHYIGGIRYLAAKTIGGPGA